MADRILHTSTVGEYTVEWIARRGYYDCNVKNGAGETVKELSYPKIGPHNSQILDDFAREAVRIALE